MRVVRRHALPITFVLCLAGILTLGLTGCAHGLFGSSFKDKVAAKLEKRFLAGQLPQDLLMRDELGRQYKALEYAPAWVSSSGVAPAAQDLLELIAQTPPDGFQLEDYHFTTAQRLVTEARAMNEEQRETEAGLDRLAEMEIVLSDAFLRLHTDYYKGKIDPRVGDPEWFVRDGKPDVLTKALALLETAGTPTQLIREAQLDSRAYAKLKEALARYRSIQQAGGWGTIPGWRPKHKHPKVRPGERDDKRIPLLRARLAITNDFQANRPLAANATTPDGFVGPSPAAAMGPYDDPGILDSQLTKALEGFQLRHGLEPDGVLGGETLVELNVPVEKRIHQLEANLERLRWLPRPIGSRYILVNITDYSLQVFEKDAPKISMKVVVGQEARRTPSFSAPLRKMVINPNWFVPHKLAAHDLLPVFQKNPESLVHKGFRVFQKKKGGMSLVDPLKVAWKSVTEENFPYKIIQAPGPYNSLGEIKFMPPNPFRIFLHGTPKKELFRKHVRTYSSGCIRVEDPIDLAEYVMKGDDEWNRDNLLKEILKGTNKSVKLPRKIPLYLLYFTAWVDTSDQVHFRKDIYARDAILAGSLRWTAQRAQWEVKRWEQLKEQERLQKEQEKLQKTPLPANPVPPPAVLVKPAGVSRVLSPDKAPGPGA